MNSGQASTFQFQNQIAARHPIRVVGYGEHGERGIGEHVQHRLFALVVQSTGHLVQEIKALPQQQGAGDGDALFFAAGNKPALTSENIRREMKTRQDLVQPAIGRLIPPVCLESKGQHQGFAYRFRAEDRFLADVGGAPPNRLYGRRIERFVFEKILPEVTR